MEKYWNSHGQFVSLETIVELEIRDRGNFSIYEIIEIFEAAGINYVEDAILDAIWVTPDYKIAESYKEHAKDPDPVEVDVSKGVLLFGTDDGDNGFLFVKKVIN